MSATEPLVSMAFLLETADYGVETEAYFSDLSLHPNGIELADAQRSGILTQGLFLAGHSHRFSLHCAQEGSLSVSVCLHSARQPTR